MHRTIFCQITSTWFLSQKSYIEPCLNERKKVSFGRHSRKINSWGNTEDIQGTSCSEMATPLASGTIRSRLCASWGPLGALTGTNGVSAEIVVTLGCEICYWLQPGTQNTSTRPGTKRCRLCASWRPWGHLSGHMGYDMGRFHGTIKFRISIGLYINFVFSVLWPGFLLVLNKVFPFMQLPQF